MCPMAMTNSPIPTVKLTPSLADEWIPRLLSPQYNGRDVTVNEGPGATISMFMTEKQRGSDVLSNST